MPRTLRDSILPALDKGSRLIGALLGLRPWLVFVRVTSWTGERPGVGTKSTTTTQITVGGGRNPQPVKVVEINEKDIIASGGLYRTSDLRVGPITPTYSDPSNKVVGGFDYSTISTPEASSGREIEWILKSTLAGRSVNGDIYQKIAEEAGKRGALDFYVVLRATGQAA